MVYPTNARSMRDCLWSILILKILRVFSINFLMDGGHSRKSPRFISFICAWLHLYENIRDASILNRSMQNGLFFTPTKQCNLHLSLEVKGCTLIKMRFSCVICSGIWVEWEQRVDEIECKVSSLSTVTAACIQRRRSDAQQRDCGVYFEAWRVAVIWFYKVIKGKKEKESAISAHPEESSQSEHHQKPSPWVDKIRRNHMSRLTWWMSEAEHGLQRLVTLRMFDQGSFSFTSWLSCGSAPNSLLKAVITTFLLSLISWTTVQTNERKHEILFLSFISPDNLNCSQGHVEQAATFHVCVCLFCIIKHT